MDSALNPLPVSEIASALAYRFIHERIIDRLLNIAAGNDAPDNEYGETALSFDEVTRAVSDYSREMQLAINSRDLLYTSLHAQVKEAVTSATITEDGILDLDQTNWEEGLVLAARAFFNPIHNALVAEGKDTGGYINVKNPRAFFAPSKQGLAQDLYGEG